MNRKFLVIVTVILSLVIVGVVAAASPTADATIVAASPDLNTGANAALGATTDSVGGLDLCNTPLALSYLKFDLTGVSTTISNDTTNSGLALLPSSVTGNGNLSIYGISDDTWTEGGITWNTAPVADTVLGLTALASAPLGSVGTEIFLSSTALNDYLNTEAAGDDTATFILAVTDCGAGASINVSSKEGADAPDLRLFSPTAVSMTNITASNDSSGLSTWSIVVVGLLLLGAVGIMLVTRRKETTI